MTALHVVAKWRIAGKGEQNSVAEAADASKSSSFLLGDARSLFASERWTQPGSHHRARSSDIPFTFFVFDEMTLLRAILRWGAETAGGQVLLLNKCSGSWPRKR